MGDCHASNLKFYRTPVGFRDANFCGAEPGRDATGLGSALVIDAALTCELARQSQQSHQASTWKRIRPPASSSKFLSSARAADYDDRS
jgi:hypothetical protein